MGERDPGADFECGQRADFVFGSLIYVEDAELLRATRHGGRTASRYDCGTDAVGQQQLDGRAVLDAAVADADRFDDIGCR